MMALLSEDDSIFIFLSHGTCTLVVYIGSGMAAQQLFYVNIKTVFIEVLSYYTQSSADAIIIVALL